MGGRVEDIARHAFADRRADIQLGIVAGLHPQGLQQPFLGVIQGQTALALQHLDRLGLLPQQEHPVRAVQGGFHLRRPVVVIRTLRGGDQGTPVFAGPPRGLFDDHRLDRIVGPGFSQLLLEFVDDQQLASVAGQVHFAGNPVQQHDRDHRMQVGAALQFFVLDDDEVVGEIDVVAPLEKARVLAFAGVGVEHHRQILQALVLMQAQLLQAAVLEGIAQRGQGQVVAMGLEQLEHHRRDGFVLHVIQAVVHRGHLGDGRFQQVDVLVDVTHLGKRVEAQVHVGAEFDVSALGLAAQLLEAAPQVLHPDLGADGAVGPGQFIEQHRLAGTGRADHRRVVVAQIVVEQVQGHQLATAAAEHQRRGAGAAPFGNQRGQVCGIG